MKTFHKFSRKISLFLAVIIFLSGCSSYTIIDSAPSDAKLYINGQPAGKTPYTYRDTKISGTTTYIKIQKEGYEDYNTFISRDEEVDVGAIVGGILLLFPFLWTMKYQPSHFYELVPVLTDEEYPAPEIPAENQSKLTKLRELKQLLDEKLITEEEYNAAKKKILEDQNP